jgi:hypothetical protein
MNQTWKTMSMMKMMNGFEDFDMYTVKNTTNAIFTYSDPKHTKLIRVDLENGDYAVYQNNKLHNEDGPALSEEGDTSFFLDGKWYTTSAWIRKVANGDASHAAFLKLKFD